MKIITLFTATVLLAFALGCSRSHNSKTAATNEQISQQPVCSLDGSWARCSSYDGSSSVLVRLSVVGHELHETIDNFSSANDCSGVSDGSMAFSAQLTIGEVGASTFVSGATDVDLVPDVDFAGCGANQTAHTLIKFSDDCGQFQASLSAPACSASDRGTDLDPSPFQKK